MALVLKNIRDGLSRLHDLQDPRTRGDWFAGSPLSLVGVVALYLYFFKRLGPRLMEHRKPFDVKRFMVLYNVVQMALNAYIVLKSFENLRRMETPLCQDVDFGVGARAMDVVHVSRVYMYLKIFDVGDTLFFLLRKSYRQVSFLHLYHHCAMLLLVWIGHGFYGGGGSGQWIILVNGFVHVAMFLYYLVTSVDGKWKRHVAFKRALTRLQLVQFVLFIGIFGKIAVFPTCGLNRILAMIFAGQNVFMLFLFGEFYRKTYGKAKER